MTIGDSIKRIRMQKEITQKELADALGVSVQAVSAYETGKRRPRMGTLNRFATALGVTVEELTQGVDFLPDDRNPGGGYIPAVEMFRMQAIQRKGVCCPVGIRMVRKDRYGHTAKRIGYCFFILKFS